VTGADASADPAGRVVAVLTTGSRVSLTIAGVFVVVAAALFWMPIMQNVPPAPPISCGSAASPSGDKAVMSLCGVKPRQQQLRAGTALAIALVIAGGGVWAFGTRPVRQEPVRDVAVDRETDHGLGPVT
jgi:hypothetical protein